MARASATRPSVDLATLAIAVFCLGGFSISLRLLYVDLRATGQAGQQERAGVLEERLEDVQRRVSTSFLWNYAERGEPLYYGDAVRVGSRGAAVVRLYRGVTLELGENSLVVLENWKDLPLHVLEGSSIVRAQEGERQVAATAGGEAKVETHELRLLEPKPYARWHFDKESAPPVRFSWRAQNEAGTDAPLRLQISPSRRFQHPAVEREAKGEELTLALPAGLWYWRLARGEKAASETRQLALRRIRVLQPVAPVADAPVFLADAQSAVTFGWAHPEAVYSGGKYRLEIATDAEFKTVAKQISVDPSRESARVKGLAPGPYWWRLRETFSDRDFLGPAEKFQLAILPKLETRVLFPADRAALEISKPVSLQWEANSGDAQFLVEWQGEGGSGKRLTGRNAHFAWAPPAAGTYRWRVTARQGDREAQSAWRTLHVFSGEPLALQNPPPEAKLAAWEAPTVRFAWAAGEKNGHRYRLEYGRDFELKGEVNVVELIPTEHAARLPSLPGTFFWRVTQLDGKGEPIRVSPLRRFAWHLPARLEPPVELIPADGVTLEPVHRDRGARLSWHELADASSYEVRISREGRAVWSSATKQNFVSLPRLLPGRYRWSVFARDPAGRAGLRAERELGIEFGATLPAPGAASAVEVP